MAGTNKEEDFMKVRRWLFMAVPLLATLLMIPGAVFATAEETSESFKDYGAEEALRVTKMPKRWITADHSRHEKLKQDFERPEQVTEACLSCHNEAGDQFTQTIHWTWVCPHDPAKKMGKAGLTLNNF
jgi:hypothetical protein